MKTVLDNNGAITREESKYLQGIAILMMLYHHLFSTPEALGTDYFSVLNFGNLNIELHMAWFFKICVGIYAFITGYGLIKACEIKKLSDDGIVKCFFGTCETVLKKLFSFYSLYWLVFIIFVPIGFLFFDRSFDFKELILNFLGIKATYNGAWWYVLQYLKMLISFPFIYVLLQKYKDIKSKIIYIIYLIFIVLVCLIGLLWFKAYLLLFIDFWQPAFYLCFISGIILAKFKVFEYFYGTVSLFKNSKLLLKILGILAIVLVIAARVKIAKDASSAGLDFIFVPVFCYGAVLCFKQFSSTFLGNILNSVWNFFGKYSTFIWLTHVFFYDHYAKKIVMASHFSTGIYLTLLLLSTLTAMALSKLVKISKH